jgi:hypothetical protein
MISKRSEDLLEQVFLHKADFWSYEEEWRMLDQRAGPGLHTFPSEALTGIIIGAEMPAADELLLRECIRKSGRELKLMKARLDNRLFHLHIEPA